MKFRAIAIAVAAATLAFSPVQAQQDYNPTGWRPATGEEKSLRESFDGAKSSWGKNDGEDMMYQCMVGWSVMADTARRTGDTFPTISGDLSHGFAEGQLSHYVNTLMANANGDSEIFLQKLSKTLQALDPAITGRPKDVMGFLGKCYVNPNSWSFSRNIFYTGPEFQRDVMGMQKADAYPSFVKNTSARDTFDRLLLKKDFAGAANYATKLINSGDKTTVYWHEVLNASLLTVSSGRGLLLDEALLDTLSKVWWPKYRRGWAKNLLRTKRGLPDPNRPPLHNPGAEPAWAKLEYQRYRAGRTNYVPCNAWHRDGCSNN